MFIESSKIILYPKRGMREGNVSNFRKGKCLSCLVAKSCTGMTVNGAGIIDFVIKEVLQKANCVQNGDVNIEEKNII